MQQMFWLLDDTHHESRPTPQTLTYKVISYFSYFLVKLLLISLDCTHYGYLCWEDYWLALTLKAGVIYLMHTQRCHVTFSRKQYFCLHSVLFSKTWLFASLRPSNVWWLQGWALPLISWIDLILIKKILIWFTCIQCRSFKWGFDLNPKINCFKGALWNH